MDKFLADKNFRKEFFSPKKNNFLWNDALTSYDYEHIFGHGIYFPFLGGSRFDNMPKYIAGAGNAYYFNDYEVGKFEEDFFVINEEFTARLRGLLLLKVGAAYKSAYKAYESGKRDVAEITDIKSLALFELKLRGDRARMQQSYTEFAGTLGDQNDGASMEDEVDTIVMKLLRMKARHQSATELMATAPSEWARLTKIADKAMHELANSLAGVRSSTEREFWSFYEGELFDQLLAEERLAIEKQIKSQVGKPNVDKTGLRIEDLVAKKD